ncbi:MAG TPA: FAD-linked oxidase C-terminal domain-containing protein [Gemmatimonadaceae bacterium]|nr:FAD-linked oxidase C-terminal domain-containing protein [Gemmatimonadaceae bacterium]
MAMPSVIARASVDEALRDNLRAIVGAQHVHERASALAVFESDALPGYHMKPSLAVFPGTRDEVIRIVRLFAERGIPYVPRGAGTGLSGGALADGVVLLGMNRLKRIIEVDPERRRALVEPGVVNAWLTAAAAPHGLHYAPDPSSQTACTIGGNVAENAGGPHCLKYGATLNHILAATVILPNGEIVSLRIPDGVTDGYDLMGAYVGSEGCFGVTLDVTVKLTPNPESIRTMLADFTTVEDAARTTSAIVAAGIIPAACELMDHGTIAAVEASIYAAGYPADAAAVLLVEVDGTNAAVEEEAARVEQICRAHNARDVKSATDPVARARLWQGRKKAFGAMGRVAPNLVVQDAVVPRTKLAEILAAISAIGKKHDITVCNVFHAGDGNLHPNVPYDGRNPDDVRRVHAAMREIMTLCIASGGTITGEHGVGIDKLAYMEDLFTDDTLDAMCRLRSVFDPGRRANPGKVVPVHSCREWSVKSVTALEQETAGDGRTQPDVAGSRTGAGRTESGGDAFVRSIVERVVAAAAAGRSVSVAGARTRVTPAAGIDLIDIRSHAGVIEYVPDDLTITVRAGTTIAELDAITLEHNQWCPFLPWGGDSGTVGGALARAQRGPMSTAFGAPRDLTLGLTFVDGRGAVVNAGGRVVKNVAGFDLTRTLIGSWGSLGAIASASLRLRARPAVRETWMVPVESVNGDALRAFVRGPAAPAAFERIPAGLATTVGGSPEDHFITMLAGGPAHVGAARTALLQIAPAREVAESVWHTVRANGPFMSNPPREPLASALRDLNARVRAMFDPSGVFVCPVQIGQ